MIRLEYAVPEATEAPTRLVAWVIGAPGATVLHERNPSA